MKSCWETHRDVRFFHFDISSFGLDDAGIIQEIDDADAIIMEEPLNSVLVLNDVRDSVGSMKVIQHLEVSAERSTPYIKRAAVVGVTGAKRILLEVVNRFSRRPIVAFDDLEKAKDWLVTEPAIN